MPDISSVIIKLEEGFWQANIDRDVTFYEKYLAENAMIVTKNDRQSWSFFVICQD